MAGSPSQQTIGAPETSSTRRRHPLFALYRSSIGRKYVMALSGIAILGFVVVHLIGTFKIFLGPESTNAYGEALRNLGEHLAPPTHVLWVLRIGLIAAFGVHLHERGKRRLAALLSGGIGLGYASIPLAVMFGFVG